VVGPRGLELLGVLVVLEGLLVVGGTCMYVCACGVCKGFRAVGGAGGAGGVAGGGGDLCVRVCVCVCKRRLSIFGCSLGVLQ